MILSNVELHRALDCRRLIIKLEPAPRTPDSNDQSGYCPYDTHSVDLTLGTEIIIPLAGNCCAFD